MAQAIPLIAAQSAASPGLFALAAGSSGLSALASIRQGQAAGLEFKQEKEQESIKAKDQEIERNRRLARVLSSQRAAAGASGFTFGGSAQNIATQDIAQADLDKSTSRLESRFRINSARSDAKSKRSISRLNAAQSLFDFGEGVAKRGDF